MRVGQKQIQFLSIAVTGILLYSLLKNMDRELFFTSLRASEISWVIGAGMLNLVFITWARAKRFSVLLKSLVPGGEGLRLIDLIMIMSAARFLNLLLPARAGDALRVFHLKKRLGLSVGSIIAAVAMETLIELVSLAIPAFALVLFTTVSKELSPALYVFGVIGGVMLGAAVVISFGRTAKGEGLRATIRSLNHPKIWGFTLFWAWVSDLTDVAMIGLCLGAVGVQLSILQWFIVLVGVNLALLLPTPGNMGTLEAGAVLTLGTMGVGRTEALAFAILYHIAHMGPTLLLGLTGLHQTHFQKEYRQGLPPQVS